MATFFNVQKPDIWHGYAKSENRFKSCLLAKFVGSNPVKLPVTFNGYDFYPIGINGVISSFTE
jgi:hypothetical protein